MNYPLSIIVPVFNAASEVSALVASLETHYPIPLEGLTFWFSDDASTDPAIDELYGTRFFQRPDVRMLRHETNVGFPRNVNSVLQALRDEGGNRDVVVLNSDTRLHGRVFESLQEEIYRIPTAATMMPLTNHGSVASLFDFPRGGSIPSCLDPTAVFTAVTSRKAGPRVVTAPSGVGFCLYIRHDALAEIGDLDESYGRGYGEEADWCRRATESGWTHHIHTGTFIEHVGAASFGKEEWARRENEVNQRLKERHPSLETDFHAFVDGDELRYCRIAIILDAIRRSSNGDAFRGVLPLLLHAPPDAPTAGGTERYCVQLEGFLMDQGFAIAEMFPAGPTSLRLRLKFRHESCLELDFDESALKDVFTLLRPDSRYLLVHHLLRWPTSTLPVVRDFDFDAKVFTLHDMFEICPSYNLVTNERKFCDVEPDPVKCNACYHEVRENEPLPSIEDYRRRNEELLSHFDAIHVPSDSALPYLAKAFGPSWPRLAPKARVLEHDLEHLFHLADSAPAQPALTERELDRTVFLGHLKITKGRELFVHAYRQLLDAGFEPEVWGCWSDDWVNDVGFKTSEFYGHEALFRQFREVPAGLVLIPSLGPETFCFAFFEALILSRETIPIVSAVGFPATVVDAEGVGVKMKEMTPSGLVAACLEARAQRQSILDRKSVYLEKLRRRQGGYYEKYAALWSTGRRREWPAAARLPVLAKRPAALRRATSRAGFTEPGPRTGAAPCAAPEPKSSSELQAFLQEALRRRRERLADPAPAAP